MNRKNEDDFVGLVFTGALLFGVFFLISGIFVAIFGDFEPNELVENVAEYSVISYSIADRDGLRIVFIGKETNSAEPYELHYAPHGTKIVTDAKNRQCILEIDSDWNGILHIPADGTSCVS